MYAFKHAPNRVKVLAILNLLLILLLVYFFPSLKLEYIPILITVYAVYFLLSIMWLVYEKSEFKQQIWLPDLGLGQRAFHFIRHFLLPIVEILSFWAIIFFIKIPYINFTLALLESYIFFLLLTNIRAYFSNTLVVELKTHFVYDLLVLTTTFFFLFALFEAKQYWGIHQIIIIFVGFVFLSLILITEAFRYQLRIKSNARFIIIFLTIILLLFGLMFFGIISSLRAVFMFTLLIYLYINLLHSLREEIKIPGRMIIETGLIMTISVLIILQIIR